MLSVSQNNSNVLNTILLDWLLCISFCNINIQIINIMFYLDHNIIFNL